MYVGVRVYMDYTSNMASSLTFPVPGGPHSMMIYRTHRQKFGHKEVRG
jgi:hypothetical protein